MNTTQIITIVDVALASMLMMHIIHECYTSRVSYFRMQRITKDFRCSVVKYFKILCNRLYGPEKMSWFKITANTLLFASFGLLTLHGSLFGLVGALSSGFMGVIKIYYHFRTPISSN